MKIKYLLITGGIILFLVWFFYFSRSTVRIPPPEKVTNDSLTQKNDSLTKLSTILLTENEGSKSYIQRLENENKKMSQAISAYSISELYYYYRRYAAEHQLDSTSVTISYH